MLDVQEVMYMTLTTEANKVAMVADSSEVVVPIMKTYVVVAAVFAATDKWFEHRVGRNNGGIY
jgi:hypothetical protein